MTKTRIDARLTGDLHHVARSAGLLDARTGGIRVLFAHGRRCDPIVATVGIRFEYQHLLKVLAEPLRQRVAFALGDVPATAMGRVPTTPDSTLTARIYRSSEVVPTLK